MKKITQSLTLDLVEIHHNIVNAHKGDRVVRDLNITITDKGTPYAIPDESFVYLRGRRADGKYVFYDIADVLDRNGGKIKVDIHDYLLSSSGRCKLDIAVYSKSQNLIGESETEIKNDNDNMEIASTESFILYIPECVINEDEIVNSDEGNALARLIESAKSTISEMIDTVDKVEQIQSLVNSRKSIWDDKYTKNEVDNKFSTLETNIDWKESVGTYADIADAYPSPQDGWTVNVRDTDYTYRYNGSNWVAISANAIPKATNSVDGLLSKEEHASFTSHVSSENNPHNVSKSQIGLGNVENKNSAAIRSELTKQNVIDALGYTPTEQDNPFGRNKTLGAETNIDTLYGSEAVGSYWCKPATTGTKPGNTGNYFSLDITYGGITVQIATIYMGDGVKVNVYKRVRCNNTWTEWKNLTPITGIKGDSESEYRTGDVNITAKNIGALPLAGGTMSGDIVGGTWKGTSGSNYGLKWSSSSVLRPVSSSYRPSLGDSTYLLNSIYATNLYEGGTSLANKYQKKIGWVDQEYTMYIGQGDVYNISATTYWKSTYTCIGYNIMRAWPKSTWTGAAVSVAMADFSGTYPTLWLTAAAYQQYEVTVRFFYV